MEKILLPGASALERLVARIRARAARRLWRTLAHDVTHEQHTKLDSLLIAGEGGRPSPLDRLRDGPYLRSSAELSRAVSRMDEVRALTLGIPKIDHVPPGRVTALARFATIAKAQAVTRMPLERRMATLLAFVRTLEATAQDDALDLFKIVVTTLSNDAAKVGKKARLRTIRDLDAAALQLRRAGSVLMDKGVTDDAVRETAFRHRLAAWRSLLHRTACPNRQVALPAGHASICLPRRHAGRAANAGRGAPSAQHRWARPGSVGTARLCATCLNLAGDELVEFYQEGDVKPCVRCHEAS